jgi:hypothetical protein
MRTPRSLVLAVTAGSVTAAALTLVACGSTAVPDAAGSHPANSGTTSAPAASTSNGTRAAAGHPCLTSALKISLDTRAAGAAAGSSYVPLEFQNVSASPCTLPDFPLVSFAAGSAGPDIGQPAVQEHATRARAVRLAHGEFAHAWLQIVDAANYPASSCKPITAQGLRIGLAAAAPTSFVARATPACSQAPQGSSILAVFPVQAGRAARGTAP